MPETFQCNDIKTKTLSRFLASSARKCLVHYLQFAQLHKPLQNLSQICEFWTTWWFIPINLQGKCRKALCITFLGQACEEQMNNREGELPDLILRDRV